MGRMTEGFNRNSVLQKELNLFNRKLSGSSGTRGEGKKCKKQKLDSERPLALAK